MLTKLTLTIEESVVERAKAYAHGRNKSISRMVEEYLRNVSDQAARVVPMRDMKSPITDKLVGMFVDSGEDYKVLLDEARSERFK